MNKPRRLWPVVTAVLIGVPVLYVASFGPACWLWSLSSGRLSPELPTVYAPVGTVIYWGPEVASNVLSWYASLALRRHVAIPIMFAERSHVYVGDFE